MYRICVQNFQSMRESHTTFFVYFHEKYFMRFLKCRRCILMHVCEHKILRTSCMYTHAVVHIHTRFSARSSRLHDFSRAGVDDQTRDNDHTNTRIKVQYAQLGQKAAEDRDNAAQVPHAASQCPAARIMNSFCMQAQVACGSSHSLLIRPPASTVHHTDASDICLT